MIHECYTCHADCGCKGVNALCDHCPPSTSVTPPVALLAVERRPEFSREAFDRLVDYALVEARCPCCEGIESCDTECTLSVDAPDRYQQVAGAREALFGDATVLEPALVWDIEGVTITIQNPKAVSLEGFADAITQQSNGALIGYVEDGAVAYRRADVPRASE